MNLEKSCLMINTICAHNIQINADKHLLNREKSPKKDYFVNNVDLYTRTNNTSSVNFGGGKFLKTINKIWGAKKKISTTEITLKPFITANQSNGGPNKTFTQKALSTLRKLENAGVQISNPTPTPQGSLEYTTKQRLILEVKSKISSGEITKSKGDALIDDINFSGKRPEILDDLHANFSESLQPEHPVSDDLDQYFHPNIPRINAIVDDITKVPSFDDYSNIDEITNISKATDLIDFTGNIENFIRTGDLSNHTEHLLDNIGGEQEHSGNIIEHLFEGLKDGLDNIKDIF